MVVHLSVPQIGNAVHGVLAQTTPKPEPALTQITAELQPINQPLPKAVRPRQPVPQIGSVQIGDPAFIISGPETAQTQITAESQPTNHSLSKDVRLKLFALKT